MGLIVICEDDVEQNNSILDLLSTYPSLSGYHFAQILTADRFQNEIGELLRDVDLLIMDIHLGSENGIALVQQFQKANPKAQVIYITGDIFACSDVYCTAHAGFIPKPVVPKKLYESIDRALSSSKIEKTALAVKSGAEIFRYSFVDILYFEKRLRKILIYTKQNMIDYFGKVNELQPQLDHRFDRCH